jgi:hypothetical protein
MARKTRIVIDQGTDFSKVIDVKSGNAAFDLTGYTVAAQRKNYASTTPTATFTATHNDALGQVTLSLANSITAALQPGREMFDVEITSTAGLITRVAEGEVSVTPGITRA